MREKYYMIDIETTGVNKETDDILEVAIVPIQFLDGYWVPQGEVFHEILHSKRTPSNPFAIEHMSALYKKCNEQDELRNYSSIGYELQGYLHPEADFLTKHTTPKFFMGWNASNFDLEFMFKKSLLTPSYYNLENGKEVLRGDAHYRVYEQTGAVELMLDVTGMSRKTLMAMAEECLPPDVKLELPPGKEHDALHDCYSQINMMNGFIALGRSGIKLPGFNV